MSYEHYAETLAKITVAVDDFINDHKTRLDQIETRISRPGAFTGGPSVVFDS